jgi:hypothetical protein
VEKEEFQIDAYFTSCHGRWKLTRIRALVDPTSINYGSVSCAGGNNQC